MVALEKYLILSSNQFLYELVGCESLRGLITIDTMDTFVFWSWFWHSESPTNCLHRPLPSTTNFFRHSHLLISTGGAEADEAANSSKLNDYGGNEVGEGNAIRCLNYRIIDRRAFLRSSAAPSSVLAATGLERNFQVFDAVMVMIVDLLFCWCCIVLVIDHPNWEPSAAD